MSDRPELDKINQILHYMKAERFSKTLAARTRGMDKWCPFQHGKKINYTCYVTNPSVQNLLLWLRRFVACGKFLDADRYTVDEMHALCEKLQHPELLITYDRFQECICAFKTFVDYVEPDMVSKYDRMTCRESIRLDEALVCFENYSFYASVVMAVSAVESRIVELIRRKNKALYNSTFSKATLGQLIQVFDLHMYTQPKYSGVKKLIPEKHQPLITLLHQYRGFSAHPKDDVITAQIAEAILHMSFCFMIDAATSPYSKKERICK